MRPLPTLPSAQTASALIEQLRCLGFSLQRLADGFLIKSVARALERLPLLAMMKNRKVNEIEGLFVLGWSYDAEVIQKYLGRDLTHQLLREGFIEETTGRLTSAFFLLEFCGIWVIADRIDAHQSGHCDFVMAPSYSTSKLATAMADSRKPCHEAGCGSGLLGLLAIKSGAQVSFSDLNPRACEFTKLNLTLNGNVSEVSVKDWKQAFADLGSGQSLVFNTPSLPDIRDRKLLVSHVGERPNTFLKELVVNYAQQNDKTKMGLFWICICLEDPFYNPEAMLTAWTAGLGIKFSFQMDADSPFALNEKQVKNNELPIPCWLVEQSNEATQLFDYLHRHNLRSVVSGILSLDFSIQSNPHHS